VTGDAGLIVPERDPAALAHAIDAVLAEADLRQRLVARGRDRARREFDWSTVAEQTLALFHSALAQRRGVARRQAVRA
jgi:glycosyltransferase involved in cell wall biosynthesis